MPEKIEKSLSEQEQLTKYSYEVSESSENEYDVEEQEEHDDEENDDDELQDIGELLGFRITGGKDFFMPITIFHVKEKSRAEKANLKLGDAILSINGKDTEDMTLVRANRYLAKVADGDVTLQVAKFNPNEDDEDVQTIEEVVLEGPISLQQRLKQMQQQLLDVSDIPPQIQSKLAMLTKALEQFMTMDADALEASWSQDEKDASSIEREMSQDIGNSEVNTDDEKQFSTIEEEIENEDIEEGKLSSTRETSYSFEDLVGDDERNLDSYDQCEAEEFSCEEEEEFVCDTEEKLQQAAERKMKNEKIQTLQKSWQKLCENQKTIHKRSNCHLVPSTALLNNKINQLNESKVISFYERKRNPQ
ncbi:hypothetical protein PVAND_006870 [Polypedilum vanderplanki]|uniref:PDZ domain-containing protein n=1 Tax=Polypedilum vanderplanki TaxID=319348 RepID=A0A9J6C658_POLVA|nr:hypothetical protein PVAND_006870 [Polypedilum vanderplanki]